MEEEIKEKLSKFRKYQKMAHEHSLVHKLEPGKPAKINTEKDILNYSKWRIKADIALNEVHTLMVKAHPGRMPWSGSELDKERDTLLNKLAKIEEWLGQ